MIVALPGAALRAWAAPRRVSSRRTPSTRAPAPTATTLRQRPQRHDRPARPGRPAATAARSPSTARNAYVGLRHARHLLPERLHARGLGAEGERDQERRRRSSAAGPAAGRCSGSTTSAARYQLTLGSNASPATSTRATTRSPGSGSTCRHLRRHAPPASTSTAPGRQPQPCSGSVGSSNTWRIGAYGSAPGGFFDGLHRRRPHLQPRAQRRRGADAT